MYHYNVSFITVSFPLRTAFTVSHRFGVLYFHFNSRYFFIFPSTHWWLLMVLLDFHIFVNVLLISSAIPL